MVTMTDFAKGSWQAAMQQASSLFDKSAKERKKAGVLLWQGATSAIGEWVETSDTDPEAENLKDALLDVMGNERKGDVSKIRTVALAVRNKGLVTSTFKSLSAAYAEATRLTKTVQAEAEEDTAAEDAVAAIEPPKSTQTVEGAAQILLSKGVDGAIVALLDALNGPSGEHNGAAHRAFARAVMTEIAARAEAAKPKPEPRKKAEPKEGVAKAKKASPKSGSSKPAKATPAKPAKAKPAKAKPATQKAAEAAETLADMAEEREVDDMFDLIEGDPVEESTEAPAPAPAPKKTAVKRARPAVKRA